MPAAVYCDISRCIGCRACELACQRENKTSRISLEVVGGLASVPVSCRQCETPLCTTPCPGGALTYRNGRLEYEAEKCTGCGLCTLACPFGAAVLRGGVFERCNVCPEKEIPACVATCPAEALFCAEAESLGKNIRYRSMEKMKKALAIRLTLAGRSEGE
jgi:Fe-S-cluster-containing hydrogenase component 2